MAQAPAAYSYSNWSPPVFLTPSSLLGVADAAPAPSPLAATGSGSGVPVAGVVAGAVAVAAVASVVSAAAAGKVGLAFLRPLWSLLADLIAGKLLSRRFPSSSNHSSSADCVISATAEYNNNHAAKIGSNQKNANSLQSSAAHLACTVTVPEEHAIDPEHLKSSASKYIQSQLSTEASKFIAVNAELLEKELEGICHSIASKINKDVDTVKESADHDLSVNGKMPTINEIVPLDTHDEATTSSSGNGVTHLATMTGNRQAINSKSSPSPVALGGNAELEKKDAQTLWKPTGEVVQVEMVGGLTKEKGKARDKAVTRAHKSSNNNRGLGRVKLSVELSARKLRLFWLCHVGGAYGRDQDASVGGVASLAPWSQASHHTVAPFMMLPLSWSSYSGRLVHNPIASFGATSPTLSSRNSSISIHQVNTPPPPNFSVNPRSTILEHGCPDYGI